MPQSALIKEQRQKIEQNFEKMLDGTNPRNISVQEKKALINQGMQYLNSIEQNYDLEKDLTLLIQNMPEDNKRAKEVLQISLAKIQMFDLLVEALGEQTDIGVQALVLLSDEELIEELIENFGEEKTKQIFEEAKASQKTLKEVAEPYLKELGIKQNTPTGEEKRDSSYSSNKIGKSTHIR